MVTSGRDRFSNDELCVLFCTHSKVTEFTVSLVQLLEGGFCLHDEIANKGTVLHSWEIVWEMLNRDTIKIDQDVSDSSWLSHKGV